VILWHVRKPGVAHLAGIEDGHRAEHRPGR
jgi:hypothetical protein